MLARMLWVLLLVFVSAAPARLDKQHRVPNIKPGLCTWSCWESIGRQRNVQVLHGLRDRVNRSGNNYGRLGANDAIVASWGKWLGRPLLLIKAQPAAGLRYRTEAGQHVIAIVEYWPGVDTAHRYHAIIVLDVTAEKIRDVDGNNKVFEDYWVTYYDPNFPEDDRVLPWQTFAAKYRYGYVLPEEKPELLSRVDAAVNDWTATEGTDALLSQLRREPPKTASPPLLVRGPLDVRSPTAGGLRTGTDAP